MFCIYGLCDFSPKQFTVRGSNCFKEWSPCAGTSGRVSSCLSFICLPSLHLSSSLGACSRVSGCLSFICLACLLPFVSQLGWCGRVFGWLFWCVSQVSFHLSSNFILCCWVSGCLSVVYLPCLPSFVSQLGSEWLGLLLPFLHLSPTSSFICLPAWVPVVGSPAASPSFHLSPSLGLCGRVFGCLSFMCLPSTFICLCPCFRSFVSQLGSLPAPPSRVSHVSFRFVSSLGACGRVSGCFSFTSSPNSLLLAGAVVGSLAGFPSWVSHVSLHLSPIITLPLSVVGLPFSLSCLPSCVSHSGMLECCGRLSPIMCLPLGCCGRVSGWLPFVCVSRFVCLPSFVATCLPLWDAVVGPMAGFLSCVSHVFISETASNSINGVLVWDAVVGAPLPVPSFVSRLAVGLRLALSQLWLLVVRCLLFPFVGIPCFPGSAVAMIWYFWYETGM